MTFYDVYFMIIGWLPAWFQVVVIGGLSALIIMLVIRLIIWIVEIIPGF